MKKGNLSKAERRRKAELLLIERKKKIGTLPLTESDTLRLVHELEVHQIQLEMQNEELIQARAEAEAAYRQYTDLYDFAPVGYFTLASDSTIRDVNLAGANLLAVERSLLVKRRFRAFVSAQSLPAFNAFFEKLLTCQGKETCELSLLKNGNELFWIQIEASCFEAGQESRAIVSDITARKQVETELHIALEKYRVLFESFPLGISVTDAAGTVIETNREAERLLGVSGDEHTQRKSDGPEWRIVRPDGTLMPAEEYASVRAFREKRLVENVEMGIVKDSGETTWINATAAPIPLKGYGVAITYGDITARKQTEEQLRLQGAAINAAANAIIITDRDGTIEWVNPAFTILTGYTAAEATGKNLYELIKSSEQDVAVYKDLWDTILAGKVWHGELINRRKDGSTYNEEETVTPLRDGNGRITHFIAVKQDITTRKLTDEALIHMSTHDALTGLYNRGFFVEEMARLERGRRFPVSIVMADVDHLKETNDQEGHDAGDALLQRVAQMLTAAFRSGDVVARIGGDEFAVLLPATDANAAKVSLQRLRQVIQENNAGRAGTPIHISLGMSTAENPGPLSNVLKEADTNMYREKQGRDTL